MVTAHLGTSVCTIAVPQARGWFSCATHLTSGVQFAIFTGVALMPKWLVANWALMSTVSSVQQIIGLHNNWVVALTYHSGPTTFPHGYFGTWDSMPGFYYSCSSSDESLQDCDTVPTPSCNITKYPNRMAGVACHPPLGSKRMRQHLTMS